MEPRTSIHDKKQTAGSIGWLKYRERLDAEVCRRHLNLWALWKHCNRSRLSRTDHPDWNNTAAHDGH
jgi:hypothetical protein